MRREGEPSPIVSELTLLQEREGWLSEAGLRDLAERLRLPLHRLESVSTFYTHFRRSPPPERELAVCRDLPCALAGGAEALARLRERDPDLAVREVSCLGRCDRAPAAQLDDGALELDLSGGDPPGGEPRELAARPEGPWAAELYADPAERYSTLRACLADDPAAHVRALEESGLRGMGGAGFPTGRKWSLVAAEPATPRYLVCNADESEPGTFKDRQILTDLPHLVVEGMALAAHAVGARRGWVFVRHEYAPERRILEAEIERAYAAGALGTDVFGSGFDFDVDVFVSPGGYILGEETALLECMEGRRGEPRNKPPFPGSRGLWGQPTLINNVETFVHAAGILGRGVEWWRGLGRGDFAGHKFVSVSGDVARPRTVLVPMGTTLGELLERAGGVKDGRKLAAVAPGGASSNCLGPERLDTPLDFEALREAGSMLGSGAAIFVAEGRDPVEVGLNVARFFRNESCGKCVPCRVGTHKAVALVERDGATPETRARLADLEATLAETSICGLGQIALSPLLSLLGDGPG